MQTLLKYLIAIVWLANGLFCKVLNLVPRHQQIVASILGDEHAALFTRLIGFSEIAMAIWVLSGWYPRLNAITQAIIIAVMNVLEYILVPDLLLWGKFNIVFAFLFISVILYQAFYRKKGIVE
ncbi:MAG: DoxX-like family protein [Agriterribacter sp.]